MLFLLFPIGSFSPTIYRESSAYSTNARPRSTLRGVFDLRVPRNEGRVKVERNWRGVDDDSVEDILIAGFAYYSRHSSVARGQRWLREFRAIDHGERSASRRLFSNQIIPLFLPLPFHRVFKTSSLRSLSQKHGLSFTIRLRSFVFSHAVERSTSERPWPSTLIAIPSSRTNFRGVVSGD